VPILTHPISWRRQANRDLTGDLTPTEQENVRKALRFLAQRYGDYTKLAKAMKSHRETVQRPARRDTRVTAGIALRAARVASVPVEDILSGAWPKPGMCPHCGRG
jgi:hypothetical protein